jgi:hypothetical protein
MIADFLGEYFCVVDESKIFRRHAGSQRERVGNVIGW